MLSDLPLLSLVIWGPILAGVGILFVGEANPGGDCSRDCYDRLMSGTERPTNAPRVTIGVTLGARVDLPWHLWVDVAVGYVQWLTKEVTTSKTLLKNPLAEPPEPRWAIANGTYENRQIATMLGIGGHFDL